MIRKFTIELELETREGPVDCPDAVRVFVGMSNLIYNHEDESIELLGAKPYRIAVTDDKGRRYSGYPRCAEINGKLVIVDSEEDEIRKRVGLLKE